MNEQSLRAANAFLQAAAKTTQPGEFLQQSPADIGRQAGLPDPLAVARAVRALAARRRLEVEDGRYRLVDTRPLEPGEPESVPRAPRRRRGRRRAPIREEPADRRPTYADLGRAIVDRLIELGRETAEAVAASEHLRREAKENRAARIEAEQRSSRLFERVKELELKLEMAEANLRTVLAAARGRGATAGPSDTEMEALLRVLKTSGGREEGEAQAEGGAALGGEAGPAGAELEAAGPEPTSPPESGGEPAPARSEGTEAAGE